MLLNVAGVILLFFVRICFLDQIRNNFDLINVGGRRELVMSFPSLKLTCHLYFLEISLLLMKK